MARERTECMKKPPAKAKPRGGRGQVVSFVPERVLAHAAKKFLTEPTSRCTKCGSTFVDHEPAFVHCRYCGRMARVASGSLPAQELFELRSGLRLAS